MPPSFCSSTDAGELRRGPAAQRLPASRRSTRSSRRAARPSSALLIAAPAAYSMAFFRTKRTRDILMWMLSTKMMPAVGALVPIYVSSATAGLLDTRRR